MSVIDFRDRAENAPANWTAVERRALDALLAARVRCGDAAEAATAITEHGDPQYFLLGPAPACDCVLSISRISGRYVMEDGDGGLLAESDNLAAIVDAASRLRLRRGRSAMVVKGLLMWYALREYFEERTDAMLEEMVEATELLGHIVPQMAVLA
jgi:hypothetical protein